MAGPWGATVDTRAVASRWFWPRACTESRAQHAASVAAMPARTASALAYRGWPDRSGHRPPAVPRQGRRQPGRAGSRLPSGRIAPGGMANEASSGPAERSTVSRDDHEFPVPDGDNRLRSPAKSPDIARSQRDDLGRVARPGFDTLSQAIDVLDVPVVGDDEQIDVARRIAVTAGRRTEQTDQRRRLRPPWATGTDGRLHVGGQMMALLCDEAGGHAPASPLTSTSS